MSRRSDSDHEGDAVELINCEITTPTRRSVTKLSPNELVSEVRRQDAEIEHLMQQVARRETQFASLLETGNHLWDAIRLQDNEIAALRDALETLTDLQVAPPFPRNRADWNAAMRAAYAALGRDDWEDQ